MVAMYDRTNPRANETLSMARKPFGASGSRLKLKLKAPVAYILTKFIAFFAVSMYHNGRDTG